MNDNRTTARAFGLIAGLTVAVAVFLVAAELAGYLLLHLQVVSTRVPTYAPFAPKAYTFWEDINEDFGVWHQPNATYRHKKSCFDITYRTNSAGARDPERQVERSTPRVVVLGDSFVEGFGIESGQRLSDLLEARTGVEHLNFGTSGSFGPTQYLLLYRSLAKRYRHDAVLVGLFPTNDFDENDPAFGRSVFHDRYRPYLVGSYPDYRIEYFVDRIEKSTYREPPDTLSRRIADFLSETSYAYNVYHYYRDSRPFRVNSGVKNQAGQSRYYEFSEDAMLRLRHVLEQIVREADGRPVTVLAIPAKRDLEAFRDRGDAPLSRRLGELSREIGFRFVDLLPEFAKVEAGSPSYFLSCDGHWSAAGNSAAARVLLERGLPWPVAAGSGAPAAAAGIATEK